MAWPSQVSFLRPIFLICKTEIITPTLQDVLRIRDNVLSEQYWHWGRFLCVCVCACVLVTQSCPTLCNPMDCSSPGSSVHGTLQGRILYWVAIPFSRVSSQSRDWIQVSRNAGKDLDMTEWLNWTDIYFGFFLVFIYLFIYLIYVWICGSVAQLLKYLPAMQETRVWFLVQEDHLERKWQPTQVFLPEESHRQRSLRGYSPWGHKSRTWLSK